MSPTLDQIVARLEDPEVPVIWLDPITPEKLWNDLPDAVAARGFGVLNLDEERRVVDHQTLLARFTEVVPSEAEGIGSLNLLRECLLQLPHRSPGGWVVMFRHPESLRQNDEETFEDFLEVVELVHASQYESHRRVFKLVVRD